MRRPLASFVVALLLAAAPLAPSGQLAAQRTRVEVMLPARERQATDGPQVRATNVLGDASLHDLMRNGFPTRMHFRLELWSDDGFINDLRGAREWDVIVRYDPLDRTYKVYEGTGDRGGLVARVPGLAEAREVAERWNMVALIPRRAGRYYYTVALDVETLSLGDLDELERWLRGDLGKVGSNPVKAGNALTRGLRTLVARLLGGERSQYQTRSGKFDVR